MTIGDILRPLKKNEAKDAVWLLSSILEKTLNEINLMADEELTQTALSRWQSAWSKRERGIPLQYCVNEAVFFGRSFYVDENVLIPRPETEVLVERALLLGDALAAQTGKAPRVVDVGAGSGAICVTLKAERADWDLVATEISSHALRTAKKNAVNFDVDIEFYHANIFPEDFVLADVGLIVSNPPYVDFKKDQVAEDVAKFEPRLALEPETEKHVPGVPERGAWIADRIIQAGVGAGVPVLVFELSPRIAQYLARRWQKLAPSYKISRFKDLAGRERFLQMEKSGG